MKYVNYEEYEQEKARRAKLDNMIFMQRYKNSQNKENN